MDSTFAERLQMASIQFVPFMMAVVFHEFGHGFIAYKWGDKTAQEQGRLTLNPLPHLDPIGTVLFPLINMISGIPILIGWAKPVPIDPRRFRKWRPGLFWVSLAGPGTNLIVALISAAAAWTLETYVDPTFSLHEPLILMSIASVQINCALGIFNLIPLPPLDGSKIIESFLPVRLAQKYELLSRYSFFILMALLLTGALSVLGPPIKYAADGILTLVGMLFPHAPPL